MLVGTSLRLYSDLAAWFHLLTPPEDYVEEADFYRRVIIESSSRAPRTLLELGSGGGNNASHLKAHFQLTLVDLSPQMLAISAALNPECEHMAGDMRSVRLDRQFDAVFVHDAVYYLTSEPDLERAMQTAFIHCRPGGVALFAPDYVREGFRPSTDHGGHDSGDRGMRYLEWTWDPDPSDTTYFTDFAYLLRDESGSVGVVHERHEGGLFSRPLWLELMARVGFQGRSVPFEHSDVEPGTTDVFVGVKPV